MTESKIRSLAKAISWRITGSTSTMLIVWATTKQIDIALNIGVLQLIANLLLYWGHERVWNLSSWQRDDK